MLVRSVTIPKAVWDRVEKEAERRGSNHSQVVRQLILENLPG